MTKSKSEATNKRRTKYCATQWLQYPTQSSRSHALSQFAPIKNKEGSDSRETALRLLTNLWKKRVGGEGLENVDVLDIEGWEGNEEKVREEVKRRAGEGETVITVWEREWE